LKFSINKNNSIRTTNVHFLGVRNKAKYSYIQTATPKNTGYGFEGEGGRTQSFCQLFTDVTVNKRKAIKQKGSKKGLNKG